MERLQLLRWWSASSLFEAVSMDSHRNELLDISWEKYWDSSVSELRESCWRISNINNIINNKNKSNKGTYAENNCYHHNYEMIRHFDGLQPHSISLKTTPNSRGEQLNKG